MYQNRYEMEKLSEMNRENVARMMEQYGAPGRKKRSGVGIVKKALQALNRSGKQGFGRQPDQVAGW
jgi:hypothetical protein